jgi:hypothetical protein
MGDAALYNTTRRFSTDLVTAGIAKTGRSSSRPDVVAADI